MLQCRRGILVSPTRVKRLNLPGEPGQSLLADERTKCSLGINFFWGQSCPPRTSHEHFRHIMGDVRLMGLVFILGPIECLCREGESQH
jgi:hypothetical protein